MQIPHSPWLGLVGMLVAIFAFLAWRLWRLRRLVRSGRLRLEPLASMGTMRAYLGAFVGTTVGLLIAHVLLVHRGPRVSELSYYVIGLALVSPIGRRWLDRFRAWLTRP